MNTISQNRIGQILRSGGLARSNAPEAPSRPFSVEQVVAPRGPVPPDVAAAIPAADA